MLFCFIMLRSLFKDYVIVSRFASTGEALNCLFFWHNSIAQESHIVLAK